MNVLTFPVVGETSRNNDIGKIAVSTDNHVTGGFGSLIALLSAIYLRYKVRLGSTTQGSR